MTLPRLLLLGSSALIVGFLLLAKDPGARAQQSQIPVAIDVVKIASGEFTMGCSNGDAACNDDEKPAHRVRITRPFEIGKYEVTQAQYQAVMGANPSANRGNNRPVEMVSRVDAQEFLNRLNARNDGFRYRLPTEAEWEYAARAGTSGPHAGSLNDVAWHAGNSEDETHPVGQKKPNAWGVYDMQGNVREWVSDWYSNTYYATSPAENPMGPSTPQRRGPPGGPDGRGGPGGRGPGGRGGPRGRGPDGFGGPGGPGPLGRGQGGPFITPCPPPAGDQNEDLKRRVACLEQQVAELSQFLQGLGPRGGGPPGDGGGPAEGLGIMRGGAWDNLEPFLRVSARYNYYGTGLKVSDVGFRIVREPVAP